MPRQNLLEAFTTKDPSQGAPPSRPTGGFGARGGAGGARRMLFLLVGLSLSFALGYAVGRGSPKVAEAKDPGSEQTTPPSRPATQKRSFQAREGAAPANARIEDSALFDPKNQYTVVAGAYSKTSPDFAWATHDHLAEEGFDVFPPVASGNLLLILVGAAPSRADLADVEARVEKLERDGKKPYDDAYRQPIDQLISRNLDKN
jgi:hypothetical protein